MRTKRRIVCAIGSLCIIGVLGIACGGGGGGAGGGSTPETAFDQGTIEAEEKVEILYHPEFPDLPDDSTSNGPTVQLICSAQDLFAKPVIARFPITEVDPKEEQYLDVLTYDEATGKREPVESWYAYEEEKLVFLTDHFSFFKPVIRQAPAPGEVWTYFNMDIDTMSYANWPHNHCPQYRLGTCMGISSSGVGFRK